MTFGGDAWQETVELIILTPYSVSVVKIYTPIQLRGLFSKLIKYVDMIRT